MPRARSRGPWPKVLRNAGGLEFQQRLAQRPLAVRVAGLAAGREGDRRGGRGTGRGRTDAVDVGEAELVGGEFRHRADAEAVEPVEHRPGLRADAVEAEHHALVEGAEQQAVAVALEQFEQAVPEGELHVRPGAQPVGDEVGEGLVALGQFEIVGRRDVEGISTVSPVRARIAGVQSSTVSRPTGLPAGSPRVSGSATEPAPNTRHEVVVAGALLLARDQREARHQVLGDLGDAADDRLGVGGAVADPARHRADEVESSRKSDTNQHGVPVRSRGASGKPTIRPGGSTSR